MIRDFKLEELPHIELWAEALLPPFATVTTSSTLIELVFTNHRYTVAALAGCNSCSKRNDTSIV
jgi:hypothetical protein